MDQIFSSSNRYLNRKDAETQRATIFLRHGVLAAELIRNSEIAIRYSYFRILDKDMEPYRPRNVLFMYTHTGGVTMGLERSKKDRMIAGVCGGIAKSLGWDPTLVRVTYVLASVLSAAFPGILVYIILWAIMPEENEKLGVPY